MNFSFVFSHFIYVSDSFSLFVFSFNPFLIHSWFSTFIFTFFPNLRVPYSHSSFVFRFSRVITFCDSVSQFLFNSCVFVFDFVQFCCCHFPPIIRVSKFSCSFFLCSCSNFPVMINLWFNFIFDSSFLLVFWIDWDFQIMHISFSCSVCFHFLWLRLRITFHCNFVLLIFPNC